MKTHIGQDRCTRCGGGSNACPVCQEILEEKTTMKRYIYKLITGNELLNGTMITQRANSRREADSVVAEYAKRANGKVEFIKSI
jgi:ferredoxin